MQSRFFLSAVMLTSLALQAHATPPASYVPSAPLPTEATPSPVVTTTLPTTTETTAIPAEETAPPAPPAPVVVQEFFTKQATFTVINKRTAKREHITVTSGIGTMSERVEINLHQCYINKAGIVPEHAALVEIFAPRGTDERASIYTGWISATHPELTVIVHPEYDVTLTRCIEEKAEPLTPPDTSTAPQE